MYTVDRYVKAFTKREALTRCYASLAPYNKRSRSNRANVTVIYLIMCRTWSRFRFCFVIARLCFHKINNFWNDKKMSSLMNRLFFPSTFPTQTSYSSQQAVSASFIQELCSVSKKVKKPSYTIIFNNFPGLINSISI